MADTSGMVEEAGEKVMTQTQELGLAIKNAASSIGNLFLPAWNTVAGVLSTTINTLSGNKEGAEDLETALKSLTSAAEDYKDAQHDAKLSTEETTLAMRDQSAAAYTQAALKMVESYEASQKAVEDYRQELENAQWQFDISNENLNAMAENLTGITGDTEAAREALAELAATGRLNNVQMREYENEAKCTMMELSTSGFSVMRTTNFTAQSWKESRHIAKASIL